MFDFVDRERYDRIILNPEIANPFPEPPASNQIVDHPAEFLVGREEQLAKLHSIYAMVAETGSPKLSYIQGSQGVGKSTLASWFIQMLGKDISHPILLIPLETTSFDSDNLSFKKLYEIMIENFLDSNVLYWMASRFVVAYLQKLEEFTGAEFTVLLEKLKVSTRKYYELKENPDIVHEIAQERGFLNSFLEVFQSYFHQVARSGLTKRYELIITLLHATIGKYQTFQALSALKGRRQFDDFEIKDETDAKRIFAEIIRIIRWLAHDAVVLIVIDHLEAAIATAERSYNALFSLLNQLRNMSCVMVVLSGTLDAFVKIEDTVKEDMNRQIENWVMDNVIRLSSLSEEEVLTICGNHLSKLYRSENMVLPPNYPLYPYSAESIRFLYNSSDRDLRSTLQKLYLHFRSLREEGKVTPVLTVFDAFKTFRKSRQSIIMSSKERYILSEKMLSETIQDKTRSSRLENALVRMLEMSSGVTGTMNVKHEPRIGKLKPDVYFELIGEDNVVYRVIIEVKLYRVGREIPPAEVEKTHSLLSGGKIDLIVWYSNIPLSSVKFDGGKEVEERVWRMHQLSTDELGYAAAINYHEDLFENMNPEMARDLLKRAGLDIAAMRERLEKLGKSKDLKIQKVPESIDTYFKSTPEEVEDSGSTPPEESVGEPTPKTEFERNCELYEGMIMSVLSRHSSKKYVQVTTLLKDLGKDGAGFVSVMSKDDACNFILEVAKRNEYRTTATRVYFK